MRLKKGILFELTVLMYIFITLCMCDIYTGFFERLFIFICVAIIGIVHIKFIRILRRKRDKSNEAIAESQNNANAQQPKKHSIILTLCFVVFVLFGIMFEVGYRFHSIWWFQLLANLFEALSLSSMSNMLKMPSQKEPLLLQEKK